MIMNQQTSLGRSRSAWRHSEFAQPIRKSGAFFQISEYLWTYPRNEAMGLRRDDYEEILGTKSQDLQLFRVGGTIMNQQTLPRMVGPMEPRKYMRMPRPKERDPLFGFSRSFLYSLTCPCERNNWTPPVSSFVLRAGPRSRCGARLIDVASLEAYIGQFRQGKVQPPTQETL